MPAEQNLRITTRSQTASTVVIQCGFCVKIVILESTDACVSFMFYKKQ